MKKNRSSRLKGFYKLTVEQRRSALEDFLGDRGAERLAETLSAPAADQLVENVVGVFGLPLGIGTNFRINDREILIPMVVEEPSVIAGASNAARMAGLGTGFVAESDPPNTVAQIEILNPSAEAAERINEAETEILSRANDTQPEIVALGGGAHRLVVRPAVGDKSRLVVHLVVNCVDAMGANIVNTMAERVSPFVEEISGGKAGLRILTNLAEQRLARSRTEIPLSALLRRGFSGEEVARGIVAASEFADADPYRAATHNKGIFNGIDAVLVATGNDWRAVEAGGHAFASLSGQYRPLARWRIEGDNLLGRIELPMAVGIVGGASRSHPTARLALELMGAGSAGELAAIVASVGLASNLAALSALCSEGIQQGHMRLHERKFKK
jgi:hydroxymethylglutaryl-CoA reductase